MSRDTIPTHAPCVTVFIGWDKPLTPYFVQVLDAPTDEDEETCRLWVGIEV